LIKAGLLPRLADKILAVYVEASPDETERRLAHVLHRQCPELAGGLDLVKMLAVLRREKRLLGGKKVLLVIDQFEQWLHARRDVQTPVLIQALRQCDGEHLQALVLVRDDFWMATTRFLRELEVPLIEGRNSAAVDLFDLRHARKVLAAYGRAFGALPEGPLTSEQEQFVERAVAGLAQEDKVISVRLSLFAEMVKGKPWLPVTLKQLGGAEGVGVAFLEETFSASSAPPEHRVHQKAARAVLRSLLPEMGIDIKGHQRSYQELLEASGYAHRPREFEDLLRILDAELRLVTPSDPEDMDDKETGKVISADSSARFYQLTHDYLVPALRQWLTRKQKETWRGRAELRLAERTAQWSPKRTTRLLPSLPEYVLLVSGVPRSKRKPPERELLRAAARFHSLRCGMILCALLLAGLGLQQYVSSLHRGTEKQRAQTHVDLVANAAPQDVPAAIEHLRPIRNLALPLLLRQFQETTEPSQRLHIAFALASFGEVKEEFLLQRIGMIPANEARNMMAALAFAKATVIPRMEQQLDKEGDAEVRARYAIMLLDLGDVAGAERVLALAPNPVARTAFIHNFEVWHGDLQSLPRLLTASNNSPFQSGICAAMGLIDSKTLVRADRDAFAEAFEHLYREVPDSGVHSSAGWALRRWNQREPVL
jgi:hypothetical protein